MRRKEEIKAKSEGQSAERRVQGNKCIGQRAESNAQVTGCKQPAPIAIGASNQQPAAIKRNSTVFQTIKPSATGIFLLTEGCISGSQPVRA